MEKLYIVIPAYNEQETIESVVREWNPIVEKYGDDSRLVIINDGSKDNTLNILRELEKEFPKLKSLDKPNGGHGATLIYEYKYKEIKQKSAVVKNTALFFIGIC